jgi:hypothetical protein
MSKIKSGFEVGKVLENEKVQIFNGNFVPATGGLVKNLK